MNITISRRFAALTAQRKSGSPRQKCSEEESKLYVFRNKPVVQKL